MFAGRRKVPLSNSPGVDVKDDSDRARWAFMSVYMLFHCVPARHFLAQMDRSRRIGEPCRPLSRCALPRYGCGRILLLFLPRFLPAPPPPLSLSSLLDSIKPGTELQFAGMCQVEITGVDAALPGCFASAG